MTGHRPKGPKIDPSQLEPPPSGTGVKPPAPARDERPFPIQGGMRQPGGFVPWYVAEAAYKTYVQYGGRGQSLERVAQRGGFGDVELLCFLLGENPSTFKLRTRMAIHAEAHTAKVQLSNERRANQKLCKEAIALREALTLMQKCRLPTKPKLENGNTVVAYSLPPHVLEVLTPLLPDVPSVYADDQDNSAS